MKKLNKLKILAAALPFLLWASCRVDKVVPPKEPIKDIVGSWGVVKATRNGVDLTTTFDFSKFKVNFGADSKYTLVNRVPFLVAKDGSYSTDDPLYPFQITLTPGTSPAVVTGFEYPLVNGKRQIKLIFNVGCNINSYTYTLQKDK
ncbi:MAG: DUF5004 domain-containing protein [Mucilaginibacter sp.]